MKRLRQGAAVAGLCLGLTTLAVFLIRQGLDRAGAWGSVLQLFVAILGSAASVYTWRVSRRQPTNRRDVQGTYDEPRPAEPTISVINQKVGNQVFAYESTVHIFRSGRIRRLRDFLPW
ncbi:hypothetical protein J5X84_41260 [Streptosporangiaceae bacterium NEAU-GS5]|nr:hypothetical protein [Streptosporangiaceae bacterium NEAU-GS5]